MQSKLSCKVQGASCGSVSQNLTVVDGGSPWRVEECIAPVALARSWHGQQAKPNQHPAPALS